MNVVIKPMGLVVVGLVFALGVAGGVTALNHRSSAAESLPPTSGASKDTPLGDGWTLKDGGKTFYQNQLGDAYREFALDGTRAPKIAPQSGKFSVAIKAESQGANQFSKYGVRIYTTGPIGLVEGWIDPKFNVLATCGRGLDWKNSPLPAGFNMHNDHILTMEWADNGSTWTITVDNDPTLRQVRSLGRPCPADRVAFVSQDSVVSYTLQP